MDMENQCSKISNLETIFGTTPQELKELSYKNRLGDDSVY